MSKRKTLAAVAAVAAFAAVSASAAGLGGLTGTSLGADVSVVASCDSSGINVNYTTTYNVAAAQYVVSAVLLTNVDATCAAKVASVTLSNNGGASLGTGTTTLTAVGTGAGTTTINLTPATAPARTVENVAVVISG